MIVLFEIKTFLDILGTLGTLTIGEMPATPDAIGTLREYGGQIPDRKFGVTGIGYEKPSIQLCFRGAPHDYSGPRTKSEIAWKALATVVPGALCAGVSTEYLMITPIQSPFPLGPMDANNRHIIACNFWITKVPSV